MILKSNLGRKFTIWAISFGLGPSQLRTQGPWTTIQFAWVSSDEWKETTYSYWGPKNPPPTRKDGNCCLTKIHCWWEYQYTQLLWRRGQPWLISSSSLYIRTVKYSCRFRKNLQSLERIAALQQINTFSDQQTAPQNARWTHPRPISSLEESIQLSLWLPYIQVIHLHVFRHL